MTDHCREAFEKWVRTCEGHPFAGQFANLMWKAWQACWNTRAQASAPEGAEAVAPFAYAYVGKPREDGWRPMDFVRAAGRWDGELKKLADLHGCEELPLYTRSNAKAEEVEIEPADLVVEAWPRDPGGMRTYNPRGVAITHKPTGLVVQCSHNRSQHLNRDAALRGIAAALSTHDKTKA